MASELKPCICGKTPRLNRKKGSAGITKTPFYREQIVCRCGVSSKIFKAPNKAVEAWNTRPAPAATDTGLVTVGGEYLDGHTWKPIPAGVTDFALRGFKTRALCDRSQAAELLAANEAERAEQWRLRREMEADRDTQKAIATSLEAELAAERAEKERLADDYQAIREQLHRGWQECRDLKADNAALTARIEGLEKHCELLCDPTIIRLEKENSDLEAKLAAAENALEPFADIADLIDAETEGMDETDELVLHFHDYEFAKWPESLFRKARAALGGKPS